MTNRICTLLALLLSVVVPAAAASRSIPVTGATLGTHDPSIARDGKTWYVFATGKTRDGGEFAVRCSEDLVHWRHCGQVFSDIPAWIKQRSPGTRELWAPDVHKVGNEFRLYYAYSLFGKNTSGIALAVNKTLDPNSPGYKWIDKGLVLESKASDSFNAIDPNFVTDADGHGWLSFGSFWDGIKMRRLDDSTGLLSSSDTHLYSLARRSPDLGSRASASAAGIQTSTGLAEHVDTLPPDSEAIEAPSVLAHGGWFYLFTSWDLCCRGAKSTYHTVVGRSRSVTGPYVDHSGKELLAGGGTPVLQANSRWAGPGGETAIHDPASGDDLLVFHAYDPSTGKPYLQLSTIAWTSDGWPEVTLA